MSTNKPTRPFLTILSTALALGLFLVPIRAYIIGWRWSWLQQPYPEVPKILIGACYDLLLVGALVLPFLALSWAVRIRWVQDIFGRIFAGICFFVLLMALVNVKMVALIGQPFTYQWFYFSDFLRGPNARLAVTSVLSWKSLVVAGGFWDAGW